jgi:hypothetical protein
MTKRTIPPDIGYYVAAWWAVYVFWFASHFAIGIAGIFLPALIASGLIQNSDSIKIVALCIAAVSGMHSLLKSDLRADRFHAAWRLLNTAKFKYEHDENYSIAELVAVYERGEQIIESAFVPVEAQPKEPTPPQSN